MYTITSDFKYFLTLSNLDMAKRLADNINGIVCLFSNGEAVIIYSYTDKYAIS